MTSLGLSGTINVLSLKVPAITGAFYFFRHTNKPTNQPPIIDMRPMRKWLFGRQPVAQNGLSLTSARMARKKPLGHRRSDGWEEQVLGLVSERP